MGVHGLWQLLQASGRPVSLETLDGKILAVDVSLWLHQTMKGMRDKDGNPLPNAHLHGLFTRICKLLFYRIKPVFVFDGGVPTLKRQTLAARRDRKEHAEKESGKANKKLLDNLLKSHAVKAALGEDTSAVYFQQPSTSRKPDIFELTPLPEVDKGETDAMNFEDDLDDERLAFINLIEEKFQSIDKIDTESSEFKSLPPEIQHEILTEMKEVRKKYFVVSEDLPEDSNEFSSFQLSKLMKRSKLSGQIEDLRKVMNARSSGDITGSLGLELSNNDIISSRVVSEDTSHYILIKGLSKKQQIQDAKECEQILAEIEEMEPKKKVKKMCFEENSNSEISSELDELMLNSEEERQRENYKKKLEEVTSAKCQDDSNSDSDEVTIIDNKAYFNPELDSDVEIVSDSKNKPEDDDSSVSDDEGFIEVTLDPNKAGEDELFPADMFNSAEVKKDFISELMKLKEKKISKSQSKIESQRQQQNMSNELLKPSEKTSEKSALQQKLCENSAQSLKSTSSNENAHSLPPTLRSENDSKNFSKSDKKPAAETHTPGKKTEAGSSKSSNLDILKELQKKKEMMQKKYMDDLCQIDVESDDFQCLPPEIQVELYTEKTKQQQSNSSDSDETLTIAADTQQTSADNKSTDGRNAQFKQKKDTQIKLPEKENGKEKSKQINISYSDDTSIMEETIKNSKEKTTKLIENGENQERGFEENEPGEVHIIENDSEKGEIGNDESNEKRELEDDSLNDRNPVTTPNDDTQECEERPLAEEKNDEEGEIPVRNFRGEFRGLNRTSLENMQDELETESEFLRHEIGKQERLATSITDQMNIEAQELLQLFGIPYIVSPMEAEAQCAFLDLSKLTHGSITDDSDIWLFGGQRVYKNFFNQNRHVELYTKAMIDSTFGLSREELINIALLCGSDYTEGIQGVGPVTALEIMAEFSGEKLLGLKKFRKWWELTQKQIKRIPENKLRNKLRSLQIIPGFPSEAVVEAYIKPTIDDSLEPFTWGTPDLDLLREYGKKKLGWTKEKVDELIKPLLKQLAETRTQTKISGYFQPENFIKPGQIKSQRIRQVLGKIKTGSDSKPEEEEEIIQPVDIKPKKPRTKKSKTSVATNEEIDSVEKSNEPQKPVRQNVKGKRKTTTKQKGKVQSKVRKIKEEVDLSESSSSEEDTKIPTPKVVPQPQPVLEESDVNSQPSSVKKEMNDSNELISDIAKNGFKKVRKGFAGPKPELKTKRPLRPIRKQTFLYQPPSQEAETQLMLDDVDWDDEDF